MLDTLDADLDDADLDDVDPFAEGDLEVLTDLGLPAAVLSVIVDDPELYADEQVSRIAAEMGFEDQLTSALRR